MGSQSATVYILQSKSNPAKTYIGVTTLPMTQRLLAHNRSRVPSTAHNKPWAVVTAIWIPDTNRAREFERYLKTGSGRAFAKRHF